MGGPNNITLSFLSSLQVDDPDEESFPLNADAVRYINHFRTYKEELAVVLYSLFNDKVFSSKMPTSLNLVWNNRLSSTAGYFSGRKEVIALSSVIIQNPEMLLSTLIHEMCHAAVKYIDKKVGLSPHGVFWRKWTIKARNIFPEIPKITVTHNYLSDMEIEDFVIPKS